MRYVFQFVFGLLILLSSTLQAEVIVEASFPANREMRYGYAIANSTDAGVKIIGIRASCSCIEAECGKNELRPGESTELTVTLKANSQSGPFSHSVYVETDSPRERFRKFVVKGNAVPLLNVSPAPRRDLGKLQAGERYEFRHELAPTSPGDRISLELVRPSLPSGTDIRLERQDGKFVLTVVVVPPIGQDKIRLDFSVRILEPAGWPDIRFALTGRIRDGGLVVLAGGAPAGGLGEFRLRDHREDQDDH